MQWQPCFAILYKLQLCYFLYPASIYRGWLVVLAESYHDGLWHKINVFPGFLTPVLTQLSFKSHRLLFSHASAEVRGQNMLERKFASMWYQTHNHQVMSLTGSPLSHLGGADRSGACNFAVFVCLLKKINIGHNVWMVNDRAFIYFHVYSLR